MNMNKKSEAKSSDFHIIPEKNEGGGKWIHLHSNLTSFLIHFVVMNRNFCNKQFYMHMFVH